MYPPEQLKEEYQRYNHMDERGRKELLHLEYDWSCHWMLLDHKEGMLGPGGKLEEGGSWITPIVKVISRDSSGGSVVKNPPFNAQDVGLILC